MHDRIQREFEAICGAKAIAGAVLEVGAVPSERSLLSMSSLSGASTKVGINLDGPHTFRDFKILKGNANAMSCFDDHSFDAVLCNATLEHDKFFWKTLAEIRRVAKPGGLIVIGVPGYKYFKVEKIKSLLKRAPLFRRLQSNPYFDVLFSTTITFEIHDYPGDYFRFSPQAMREVLLEGMDDIDIRSIMIPPRLIGIGRKPLN
jgi:SAM-dependent methyltransferase